MHNHELYGYVVRAPEVLPAPAADPTDIPDIILNISQSPVFTDDILPRDGFGYLREATGDVLVRWYDRLDFRVGGDGRHIQGYARGDTPAEALYTYLLTQAVSIALLQRGVEGLHATAFERDGAAVALIGECGFGKSTITAHALRRGARLLTDDLLICSGRMVLRGAARIKLEPAMAAQTLGPRAGTPMYDERGKWIYALGPDEFAAAPVPLHAIYALAPDSTSLRKERLDSKAAFRELVQATFDPLEKNAARLASHMRYHAALVQQIPVFKLHVPRNLDLLDDVLALIL